MAGRDRESPHKDALRRCYTRFIEDLDPEPILDHFMIHDFLPFTTIRDIREHTLTTTEKNRRIMEIVMTKDERGYRIFLKCLKDTHQPYLADLLEEQYRTLQEEQYRTLQEEKYPTLPEKKYSTPLEEQYRKVIDETKRAVSGDQDQPGLSEEVLPGLSEEVLRMDKRSIELYIQTLADGEVKDQDIRVMIVGQFGVGKSALRKRLLDQPFNVDERDPTDGIEVYTRSCRVKLGDGQWEVQDQDNKIRDPVRRIAKLMKAREAMPRPKQRPEPQGNTEELEHLDIERQATPMPLHKDSSEDKDMKQEPEDIKFQEELKEIFAEMKQVDNLDDAYVSIWDFAGQSLYYSTHQVFMSQRAVYLLVVDMSQHMADIVREADCVFDSGESQTCKVSEYIEDWLNSIHKFTPSKDPRLPRIILVGAKKDRLRPDDEVSEFFEAVKNLPSVETTGVHLVDTEIALDNTLEHDPALTELKAKIIEVAKELPYWGKSKPAKWIILEKTLAELCQGGKKKKKKKVITKAEILEMGKSMPVPLSVEDVDLFLHLHHEMGTLIYYSDIVMNNAQQVLLDPQWLVDALKSIVTYKRASFQEPELKQDWDKFKKTAKLNHPLIAAIWKSDKKKEFIKHESFLLSLMERLYLLVKLPDTNKQNSVENQSISCGDACSLEGATVLPLGVNRDVDTLAPNGDTATVLTQYLVPCMLHDTPSLDKLPKAIHGICYCTPKLCLTVPSKFISAAAFNKLQAACASKWTIACKNKETMIFCGCGNFEVDKQHWLTIYFWEHVIQMWVTQFGKTVDNQRLQSACKEVLNFVLDTLTKSAQLGSDIEKSLKCPNVPLHSKDGMINESDLEEAEITCHVHDDPHLLNTLEMKRGWFGNPATDASTDGMSASASGSDLTDSTKMPEKPRSFEFDEKMVLGKGATSDVFKGTYSQRPVAVKRILCTGPKNEEEMNRESLILNAMEEGRHQNIVGFYLYERHEPYLYLLLELCDGSLMDYVKAENSSWRDIIGPQEVNRNMAEGLKYLHLQNIVHRDLKPHNVLFNFNGTNGCKVCLADFGMAKRSQDGAFSVSGSFGTNGFVAPEVTDVDSGQVKVERCDNRADVFGLGILFHFSYTTGKHPFESQTNINKGKKCLKDMYTIDHNCGILVEAMLDPDPSLRPYIVEVCEHSALWSDEYVMDFYDKVSDALESDKTNWSRLQDPHLIPHGNWMANLKPNLKMYLAEYPPRARVPFYKGHEASAYHLLRAIRNTHHHHETYPTGAREELGSYPTGHLKVWKEVCPKLLHHVCVSLPRLKLQWDKEKREIKKI